MSDDLRRLLTEASQSHTSASVAKIISAVELAGTKAYEIPQILKPQKLSFRIGITGPPGAGKSTLIGQLIDRLKQDNNRVGVLAIDPTSPVSQGAVLGDRIRYNNQASDKVFIRSLGTRGSMGGLAAHAYLFARVFDACEFDFTIIETVGIGQIEIDVMNVADLVVLVLVPESGDSVQAMKAGVIEIADAIVVNKSDRPGAEALKHEIEAQLALGNSSPLPPVLTISAMQNEGIYGLVEWLKKEQLKNWGEKRHSSKRLRAEALALKRDEIEAQVFNLTSKIQTPSDLKAFFLK